MITSKKLNLWKWVMKVGDPYPLIRPFLFMMDPEDAHNLTIKVLGYGLGPRFYGPDDEILRCKLFGLDFPNVVGMACGLDKQASCMDAFMGFGFGFIELGGVTPKPQPGNPRPRMYRVNEAKALINRFGFNSVGLDVFVERMKKWRETPHRTTNPVGVSAAKNTATENDIDDFILDLRAVAPYSDFFTINISCPNTGDAQKLQVCEVMTALVSRVTNVRDEIRPSLPVLLKISPDLNEEQQKDVANVLLNSNIQGCIISNTTITRPSTIPNELAAKAGGLSGPPLFGPSTRVLANIYKLTEGKVPLIGCGGISNGQEAYAKIRAGASMIQILTALVFEGPMVVEKIKHELAELLRRDGFNNVSEAVGADHR